MSRKVFEVAPSPVTSFTRRSQRGEGGKEEAMDVKAAIAKHDAYLRTFPRVNGVGEGKGAKGRPAIVVLVELRVPEHEKLPKKLEGFDVLVQDVGHLEAQEKDADEEAP